MKGHFREDLVSEYLVFTAGNKQFRQLRRRFLGPPLHPKEQTPRHDDTTRNIREHRGDAGRRERAGEKGAEGS